MNTQYLAGKALSQALKDAVAAGISRDDIRTVVNGFLDGKSMREISVEVGSSPESVELSTGVSAQHPLWDRRL